MLMSRKWKLGAWKSTNQIVKTTEQKRIFTISFTTCTHLTTTLRALLVWAFHILSLQVNVEVEPIGFHCEVRATWGFLYGSARAS